MDDMQQKLDSILGNPEMMGKIMSLAQSFNQQKQDPTPSTPQQAPPMPNIDPAMLQKIAGFMHDIGNAVNRKNHAEYGALLAETILRNTDLPLDDRVMIVSAIGHHDESTGGARDAVSAALIIADKTDVRRNRVRPQETNFDIHDRVNYAVTDNKLMINPETRKITLEIEVDESICTMYEYFDIFLGRMLMSRAAAEMLDAKFSLFVNGSKVL